MLKVLHPGFYCTIQDSGRFGYRSLGVPVSGVMDTYSRRYANTLLRNHENDAVLEMTMQGGKFQFLEPTQIVISGADMQPRLNAIPINNNTVIDIKRNDSLEFGKLKSGVRAYLAIKGGFKTETILGSRSQYKSITKDFRLHKNDVIAYDFNNSIIKVSHSSVKYDDSILKSEKLEVYEGPEFKFLSQKQKQELTEIKFTITNKNSRMAYQLEPLLANEMPSILTSPVLPGTVQLTPLGQLIVLMRDCQTTGGYPRIFQLTEQSLNILSQKSTKQSIRFRLL